MQTLSSKASWTGSPARACWIFQASLNEGGAKAPGFPGRQAGVEFQDVNLAILHQVTDEKNARVAKVFFLKTPFDFA